MSNTDREAFWKVLYNMHDIQQEHVKKLMDAVKPPRYLCRFRPVTERTLMQLQNNQLFFSTADYYDDPFDTFIHFNLEQLKQIYRNLKEHVDKDDPSLIEMIRPFQSLIGTDINAFKQSLKDNPLNESLFAKGLLDVRSLVQKSIHSICFCEDSFNEALWLKYADNYKGFVLVYDMDGKHSFSCGKEDTIQNCSSANNTASIYPVYYSDQAYDATWYAINMLVFYSVYNPAACSPSPLESTIIENTLWEPERISLIKKKCHEYDKEWRMIRSQMSLERSSISIRPYKVITGFRMPEYEKRLVVSAGKIASIPHIEELYINDSDQLDSRQIIL